MASKYSRFEPIKTITGAEDNADLVEKKQDYYDKEGQIMDKLLTAYKNLIKYNELEITKEKVEEMKTVMNGVEEKYKIFHEKMVKDLYDTQGMTVFDGGAINFNYSVSESDVNEEHPNSYLNNMGDAIEKYVNAKNNSS